MEVDRSRPAMESRTLSGRRSSIGRPANEIVRRGTIGKENGSPAIPRRTEFVKGRLANGNRKGRIRRPRRTSERPRPPGRPSPLDEPRLRLAAAFPRDAERVVGPPGDPSAKPRLTTTRPGARREHLSCLVSKSFPRAVAASRQHGMHTSAMKPPACALLEFLPKLACMGTRSYSPDRDFSAVLTTVGESPPLSRAPAR